MIPKTLEIGFFTFHTYGSILSFAALIGWYIAKKRAHIYKINLDLFDDWILIIPLFTAIVGARLYHVLDYWDLYKSSPRSIFLIQNGGLGIWGWLIGVIFGIYIVCKLKQIKFLTVMDLIVPSIALGQSIGRIANWINQEGFGPPTNVPWKVFISPQNRPEQFLLASHFHPTYFYESILNFLSFLILISLSRKLKRPGQIFALYLIYYSITRFFMEFLRIDTWVVGDLKIAQIISLFGLSAGIIMLTRIKAKSRVDTP